MSIIKNSRESTTLQILIPMLITVWVKFVLAGLTISTYQFPAMSASEFVAAIAGLMLIWLGREWRSSHYKTDVKVVPNAI